MPFGKGTESYSVKNTKNKPGATREQECNQVKAAQRLPYPAKKIKDRNGCMENQKENIQKRIHMNLVSCNKCIIFIR